MGTSMNTGPGRPVTARLKARDRMSGSMVGSCTRQAFLTKGR